MWIPEQCTEALAIAFSENRRLIASEDKEVSSAKACIDADVTYRISKTEYSRCILNGENVTWQAPQGRSRQYGVQNVCLSRRSGKNLVRLAAETLAREHRCDHGRTGYRNKYSSECGCENLSDCQRRYKSKTQI